VGTLLARATARATQAHIHHLTPVAPGAATGLVKRVYGQVAHDFGLLAPPVSLHAPAPEALAACWLMLRETIVADGPTARAGKEAVAAAVSVGNACPYCVEVHSTTMFGLVGGRAGRAVAEDRLDDVADPDVRALARWARGGGPPPVPTAEAAAEVIGVAATFHYLNRMVNVFLPASPLPAELPPAARRPLRHVAGRLLGAFAARRRPPGRALPLLPDAPLPADLSWAAPRPGVAGAFARAAAVFDAAGERSVPAPVRRLVLDRLAAWDGTPPGPSRAWADDAAAGLPAGHRAAGRLALLACFASYQVTGSVIAPLDDRRLVELVGWASFTAARRLCSELSSE
jgi:alkylhydroperoxidase family enzyme